ncbi:restriction endonuclease subunit S [Pseudomonas indica]|uniref:restriction endonuclease subunit S n=1 Tax=Pseudomonas indica TaxID=137658 RepID=UPI003FD287AA
MSAEVRPGYKLTEVGVIPEDWESTNLGSVVQLQRGFDLPSRLRHIGDVPIVSSSGVTAAHNRAQAEGPGVVTGRYGTIGEVFYIETAYWPLNTTLYVKDFKGNCQKFIYYLLRTIDFQAHSGKSGVPGVNRNDIHQLLVAKPPLPQQEKIAEVLSDIDSLISSLDQLIAKKRDIKQAAMQQLLTGKKRLPGFSDKWEARQLGEIANIQRGASPRPIDSPVWFDDNSSIGWVRISDVTRSDMFLQETTQRLSELGVRHSRPVSRGNLIMSICATVGRPVITEIDTCIHDGFVVFDNLKVNKYFAYYFLKFIEGNWSKHGQTGSQMNLNTGLIKSTEIAVPASDEQTAIATLLADMDAELAALEQRRDKAKLLKQGMMQELLSGRIRLL